MIFVEFVFDLTEIKRNHLVISNPVFFRCCFEHDICYDSIMESGKCGWFESAVYYKSYKHHCLDCSKFISNHRFLLVMTCNELAIPISKMFKSASLGFSLNVKLCKGLQTCLTKSYR